MVFNADDEMSKLELEWFFNYSEADCGLKSNWNAMVRAALLPGGGWSDPYNPFILQAIDKRRDISTAYYKLTQDQQNCLFAIYGPAPIPFAVEKVFKELAGAAMLAKVSAPPDLIKLCQRILQFKASNQDKIQISQIRMEALSLRKAALYEYRKAKKANK